MTEIEYQILKNKMSIKKMKKVMKNVEEAHILGESPIASPEPQLRTFVYQVKETGEGTLEIGKQEGGFSLYEIIGFLNLETARITKTVIEGLKEN
ncbi:MAG: hypothetical protein [Cryophage ML09]|nr:MAG: hypothetical protein [Cryophage ML09]